MVLGVEIDPVGGDEGALPPGGAGGAGGAEGVGRRALDTGVFGDVPEPGDQREPCRHRQQPEHEPGPPDASQDEDQQQGEVDQQKRRHRPAGDHGAFGEVLVTAGGEGPEGEKHPLFEEGLAGQVAQDLAAQGGAGDREGGGKDQVGVLGLLGVFMMGEMIRPVGGERGADGDGAQPVAEKVVQPSVRRQAAVRRLMHQDGQAQLARADHGDAERDQDRPEDARGHGQGDDGPAVQHQQGADPGRARLEGRPLVGREQVERTGAGRG